MRSTALCTTRSGNLLKNLRVYAGSEHPHEAQNPTVYDFGAQNAKNRRTA